jgi:methionyl-tRNA formyltransferase
LKVVFLGTPEFAVPSLEALIDASDVEVPLVVTQPDRPAGRGLSPRPSPVALAAEKAGLPIERPERLRGEPELSARLRATACDFLVVVAYGRILPDEMLAVPRLAPVNVHASLLPRFRGASPIQAAILAGDAMTGVCTMRITSGLDEGPIYACEEIAIAPDDDSASLGARLAVEGAALLLRTLGGIAAGTLRERRQVGTPVYCRPVARCDGEVNWSLPAGEIERAARAYRPWPGLFTYLGPARIKLLDVAPASASLDPGSAEIAGEALVVGCGGRTALEVRTLQREGKRAVSGAELARSVGGPVRFGR